MAVINQVGNTLNGATGTGKFVGENTPTLITPMIGNAIATSINFGATALANYDEQDFTPVFSFATLGDLSVVYTNQVAKATRIGRLVTVHVRLSCTPTFTTSAGSFQITGCPFTASNTFTNGLFPGSLSNNIGVTYPAGRTTCVPTIAANTSTLNLTGIGSAVSNSTLTTTAFVTATSVILNFVIIFYV